MSISTALSSALSGLTVTSRMAGIVSSNVANALTDGYARRELELSPRTITGGVRADGVIRHSNAALVGERRDSISANADADIFATYSQRVERLFGTPEEPDSLLAALTRFEGALISAVSRPDLPERLTGVLDGARALAGKFGAMSEGIQSLREGADAEIAAATRKGNDLLSQIAELNQSISKAANSGGDTASLQDHRQRAIDDLAELVPLRQASRAGGAVALFTPGGQILLDGTPAKLDFTNSAVITPYQTIEADLLSPLRINGREVNTSADGPLAGGRLGALFQVRDSLAVAAQGELDAAARDLVERFQDAGLDATRALGDPGLFTDNGSTFDAVSEIGISARLSINPVADPVQGGATWRLRDGLGAATPGPVGNSGLLTQLKDALTSRRAPQSGSFTGGALTSTGLASRLLSRTAADRLSAETSLAFASSRHAEVEERYLAQGVDTDQEMQNLILIEQAYGANAKVIQTIDDMMNALLRI